MPNQSFRTWSTAARKAFWWLEPRVSLLNLGINYWILYIFSYPFMVGGSLMPVATEFSSSLLPGSTLDMTSSTRPFCRLKEGHIHTPQLHFIPCHAYCPSFALHLIFGHSRRPESKPCSSSERIQESGERKWCVQALCSGAGGIMGVRLAIGPVWVWRVCGGGLGRWAIRYGVVASVRLRDFISVLVPPTKTVYIGQL